MTNYPPNAFAPGVVSDAFIPDQLIAGHLNLVTDTVTIGGAAALVRGSVLGRYVTAATEVAAAVGGNTGNGAMGAVTASGPVMEGVYTLRITKAAANAGDFAVRDPLGNVIGLGTVGVLFNVGGLSFTLADGAADFAVGDSFTITVTELTEKYKLSAAAATDGSQIPAAILADAVDASGGDKAGGVYLMGEFNGAALTLGAGHTLASVKAALRSKGIFIKSSVSAADPT